jgi:hypothetical protein
MNDGDTVEDEGEDVSNSLGGDGRHGLVFRRDCGETSVQEGGYGQIL